MSDHIRVIAGLAPNALTESRRDTETGGAPLLLTARRAAAMCGVSLRTWRSWDSGGRIPKPIRIGRRTLWRSEELSRWTSAGCPRRKEWEAQT
jgi:predicted DNA-binding transcriptional regulator AlpA